MDTRKFDAITQALAADGSRRRMLGVLAGGVAALAGAAALEAKRGGNGKGRGRGRANRGNGNGNGNGGGQGAGQEKVTLCHRNNGKKGFKLITVGAPAVPAHEAHGDVVCAAAACQAVAGCGINDDSGEAECLFEAAADDTACTTDDGLEGTCVDGACEAADPEPGEEG